MPPVNYNSAEYLLSLIQDLQAQLRAMQSQQNFTIVDATFSRRLVVGMQPAQPGDTATRYSADAYDTNGVLRASLGQLPLNNGGYDYGLMVQDSLGTTTEILPVYSNQVTTEEFTSSTTYVDLTTVGPTVTAVIGQSGQALITVNAFIATPGSASAINAGYVGVSVDGAAPTGVLDRVLYLSISTGTSGTGLACNQSAQLVLTGLTPGTHTFKMQYKGPSPSTGSVGFGERFLQVRPL